MSEPVRWVIPAVLIACCLGIPLSLLWEKVRPSSYTRSRAREGVGEAAAWQRMSTCEQAACDRAALQDAEEAARVAVDRAAEINVLYRP